MERSEHAAIKIEATAPQSVCAGTASPAAKAWWLFCALVVAIKLLLLWLDPAPKLFMGDSRSYIRTALTGSTLGGRSYFYGYIIRCLAVWPQSFTPLLVVQALASGLKDLQLRNAQRFGKGFLIDRWRPIENNRKKSDRIAKETAMNALRRRPLQVVGLAMKTDMGYWAIASVQSYAPEDLGYGELSDDQLKVLAEKFRFITGKLLPSQPFSLLQRYFLGGWPYYFIIVVSPLTCALATWSAGSEHLRFFCLFMLQS